MKKSINTVVLIFLFILSLSAQNNRVYIQGKVTEELSNEPLISASVYVLNSKQGTSTDAFGLFGIYIPKGKHSILISYVGYETDTLSIDVVEELKLDINLRPRKLGEVVVSANKIKISDRLGSFSMPMEQLKSIPALLGEADVLRALTMLPGVSNGTEGSVGLNVRGGSADQNLILLDGAPIYNSAHLFGFLSAFNPDAIKRVELIKGGFPARYGGRLSSVIDITFKDGNKEKKNIEFGIGILSSKLFVEAPIKKGRSSFMIAARASYLDLLTIWTKQDFYKRGGEKYQNYNFYDINAKVNFLIGKNGSLTAGIFKGNDFFINARRSNGVQQMNQLAWSNSIANIRYVQPIAKKIVFSTQLTFNRYYYNFAFKNVRDTASTSTDLNYNYSSSTYIYDVGYKNNFNWTLNDKSNLSFGTELYRQFFKPNIFKTQVENVDIPSSQNFNLRKAFGTAFFTDINTKWTTHLNTNVGVRLVNYNIEKENYAYAEPRISVSYDINEDNSFKGGYSIMHQPLHLLSNNTVGFTNDAWVPATKLTPPESAKQFSLGFVHNFPNQNLYTSIEVYHKTMTNLIDYSDGSSPIFDNAAKGYEQVVQKNGIGRAYGLEFLIHKEAGRFNGILEYTLARTERQFDKINFGRWYPSRFDRTHDFGLTLNYELTKKWSISSTFVYSTGTTFSGPDYVYTEGRVFTSINQPIINPFYRSKNNLRLPAYHRMDLGVTYKKRNEKGHQIQWSFGAYNVYNRSNVIAANYFPSLIIQDIGIPPLGFDGVYLKSSLLPFIPYLTYNYKF